MNCPYCQGMGKIKTHESILIQIERDLKKVIQCQEQFAIELITHPELYKQTSREDKKYLEQLAESLHAKLTWKTNDSLHMNDYQFISSISEKQIEL